jgi:DNA (cytosine-5)-methyltransferase 1
MSRPLLLDLYCGAGGAAAGYHQAGFDIIGVDNQPQPHYPYEFHQTDALDFLQTDYHNIWPITAVHASPPCQHYCNVTKWRGTPDNHPDLLDETRQLLTQTGLPYIIENVPEAGLRPDFILCGSMFGLSIRRHRVFETSWRGHQFTSPCSHHREVRPFMHKAERAYADAMGCTWMTSLEAREAVPPAYTEYIGTQLMAFIKAAA